MTTKSVVAAVTGANKGIGLAIVRNLALSYPSSPLHSGPFLIYLAARSSERAQEALESLYNDPQLKKAKVLVADGGETTIKFKALDISDSSSIRDFSGALKSEHPDGIDILVNNAGIALSGFDHKMAQQTIHTNYYGSLAMTQSILPQIRPGGRLVNVCSLAGELKYFPSQTQDALVSASQTSVDACTALMEKFVSSVADGRVEQEGWPKKAYSASKAGEIAVTKAIAGIEQKKGNSVLINACCPGSVKSDMNKNGTKTLDEGAKTPVLLALGDIGGVTGGFWQDEKAGEW